MQLTPIQPGRAEPDERPDGHGIDTVAGRVQAATAQLTTIAQELTHHEREWRELRGRLRLEGHQRGERLALVAQGEADPLAAAETAVAALEAARERRQTLVAEAGVRLRRRLRSDLERCSAAAEEQANTARHALAKRHQAPQADDLAKRQAAALAELEALKARIAKLDADLLRGTRAAGRAMRRVAEPAAAPAAQTAEGGTDRQLAALQQQVAEAEALAARITGGAAFTNSRVPGVLLNHGLVALPHLGAALLLPLVQLGQHLPWVAGSALATQLLLPLFTASQRRRLAGQLGALRAALRPLNERQMHVAWLARQELDPQGPLQQRLERVVAVDAGLATALDRLRASTAQGLARARQREQRLRERLGERCVREAAELRRVAGEQDAAAKVRLAQAQAADQTALERALAEGDERLAARRADLHGRWSAALAALRDYADGRLRDCAALHPAWPAAGRPAPAWDAWIAAVAFPGEIPVGRARLPLATLAAACGGQGFPTPDATLEVPVALAFPSPASLLVRASPEGRAAALRLVNQTVLRALAAFPPGRLRLTLIDPVGLGEAFSTLLDLADHEDSLLGRGVLNEAGAIDQGLGDLVAHMEMVIQKHLRGRYATIEDYNREAGEMQEALHLVVVTDFPAGFGERALERLMVLARSGARCGVHLIVLHDDRRTLPPTLDLAWFRRTGIVLRDIQGRLVLDREELHDWTFAAEGAPPPELAARLVAEVGRAAQHGQRVQVPFAAVAPPDGRLWSQSSAAGLKVPLGKRGADRLQYLELGRGTAQHVLVGGRTGSGKSTLFHVLIASAALWYHPREVEFHLIDFKKGVEFKSYATHRLPHARVIAIESDREFGLSVLRNLDHELARRGDAFRKAGAQDLAAHRAAGGEHLPRIVLLIDEFQELFTEDDAVARDAALLLDRFVRQGRAFGLHVVLGSQTLGGSYSLAKSSLGQMGVRIVLPCNEADAHLLLNEDNDAARLLARPGDAIYNDHAGLAEGNSPFQVCWLGDEQEQGHLRAIAARAATDPWRAARPTVVFEGNEPAALADDSALAALLAGQAAAPTGATLRAGIGQSSSLKGTSEVQFPAAAGGNLLIVGQNREAAAATCAALALGLAARRAPGVLRLLALDGEDREGPFAQLCAQLAEHLPHHPVRHEVRGLVALLAELDALLARRIAGEDTDGGPVLLTVFALQRIRQLRPDEDLGFGRGGDGPPPAERFANLLANGPEYGIHTVVWCDSLASVQRGLGRRALRDFDARILFQMGAADSTELIDDDGASRLGLHTALLVEQGEGRREKLRPYRLPEPGFIAGIGAALSARPS